jgi:hypothetical protein
MHFQGSRTIATYRRQPCALTPPSRGRPQAGFAHLRPPLTSNVRRQYRASPKVAGFKHHSNFPRSKSKQRYLFPFVCFACRKTFRKPHSVPPRLCPQCVQPMTMLGRKFHSPKASDLAQWKKVRMLVEHGFFFQSVYRAAPEGGKRVAPYLSSLSEVASFVLEFSDQAESKQPAAWATPRTNALGEIK